MKTRNTLLCSFFSLCCLLTSTTAFADVKLGFERTGTDSQSVNIHLTDQNGKAIEGASATLSGSHPFMATKGNVTNRVICPDVNGTDKPTIKLSINIKGLVTPQKYTIVGLDIHAFNKNGGYQKNTNDKPRKFNVDVEVGKSTDALTAFGTLNDIDIAANVGTEGNVHQLWTIKNEQSFTAEGDYNIELTITTGSENAGCFFGLSEIVLQENDAPQPQPICPFKPSPAIGNADVCYTVQNPSGKVLEMATDGNLKWSTYQDQQEQIWYFVEKDGGYLIVNQKDNRTVNINNETVWTVENNTEGEGFIFLPKSTASDLSTKLTVEGESIFIFQNVRNAFSRAAQIYNIPCGVLGENYITRLSVNGDVIKPMKYPLAEVQLDELTDPIGQEPTGEYYIYTEDKATAASGCTFNLNVQLNKAPIEGLEGFVYFDWNRDGIFETMKKMELTQNSTTEITVPNNVKPGKTRVRIRLTDNGMTGAEDEVNGQFFDWILNLTSAAPESYNLQVKANDDSRGTVTASETAGWMIPCTVSATPKGNSKFVCWREGLQIVSLAAEFGFTLNHETQLTAIFSPNTDDSTTGIEENLAEKNQLIHITAENQTIKVETTAKVKKVLVFRPNGQLVAQSVNDTVLLNNTETGTYIVKVYTETTDETAKILLK